MIGMQIRAAMIAESIVRSEVLHATMKNVSLMAETEKVQVLGAPLVDFQSLPLLRVHEGHISHWDRL